MKSSFWKSGHTPTLFAAFLYFDLSFMVWYLLGPLAVQIAADLHLTTQQRGLVVATPILAGAVLRFLMGMLADRLSPKTAGIIGQVIVIGALSVPGNWASTAMNRRCCWVCSSAWPVLRSPWRCHWLHSGTPPNTRAKPWALPARATPGPCSRH
ncbi:MAG: Nitrate transporter [Pseudomonas fluorescens]|nr:MAG: Nitrate transporter [Pseudomonas fluorescens]